MRRRLACSVLAAPLMRRTALVAPALAGAVMLAAAGPAAAADAAGIDPLQSSECRDALAALTRREAAGADARPPANARAPDAALQAARAQAARACLASRADPPVPRRLAQPPLAVPPVTTAHPVLPVLPAPPPSLAIAPRPAEPPRFTLTCDAIGCFANDGTRLNRVGPDLWGPRGACSVHGTILQCP